MALVAEVAYMWLEEHLGCSELNNQDNHSFQKHGSYEIHAKHGMSDLHKVVISPFGKAAQGLPCRSLILFAHLANYRNQRASRPMVALSLELCFVARPLKPLIKKLFLAICGL